jgi:hypothetical protein
MLPQVLKPPLLLLLLLCLASVEYGDSVLRFDVFLQIQHSC